MLKSAEMKIYETDKNKNKIGKPIQLLDELLLESKKVTILFESNEEITLNQIVNIGYDSDYRLTVTNSLFDLNLYNAFINRSIVKNIKIEGFAYDASKYGDLDDPYYFETSFENLKISSYNGVLGGIEYVQDHEYKFANIFED